MKNNLSVSIVIPNWNGRGLLAEFLPSVISAAEHYRKESGCAVEVVIVDDASTDDSVAWLQETYSNKVEIVRCLTNGGFSKAANSGFREAQYPIILLLNNDIKVEVDVIAPLVTHFKDQEVFAVGCKAYRLGTDLFDGAGKLGLFQKGHWRVFINYDVLPTLLTENNNHFYSFVASGGYVAFDAAKLHKLGGFCELLSPFYWEDVDICYRAWKRGWTVEYEPKSIVHHKTSSTIGKKFKSKEVEIIAERNRLLLHWINLHDPVWFLLHIFWLVMKLLGGAFSLKLVMWAAFFEALKRLPEVRRLRDREKRAAKCSDREIEKVFTELTASKWAVPIRNNQDYYQYVELKKRLEEEKKGYG